MKQKVFADTGYWIALLNPNDSLHSKAKQLAQGLANTQLFTSEMIFAELLNAFSKQGKNYRVRAVQFVEYLHQSSEVKVIQQTNELFIAGLELYKQRPDQAWSHTDCSSFYIMQERDILQALAYDKHFEQAGFVALLRES
jgi:predicted nucleic acid-binding protein